MGEQEEERNRWHLAMSSSRAVMTCRVLDTHVMRCNLHEHPCRDD